jgi:hypothetical protein
MRPSRELLDKMRRSVESMEEILRVDKLSAETQIADTATFCWAVVELAFRLQ